ncbi:MAG: hypothetical protein FH749_06935 [Firmicutes bacterium]|nr:hypothetical protein [Bacillota bacterium]
MSVERFYGSQDVYFLTCDVCGEEPPEIFNDFDDAVDYKKANGWQSKKRNGEWEDICPDCQDVEMGLI